MNKSARICFLLFLLLVLFPNLISGQLDQIDAYPAKVKIELKDGTEKVCILISKEQGVYYFEMLDLGKFSVPQKKIKRLEVLEYQLRWEIAKKDLPVKVFLKTIDGTQLACELLSVEKLNYTFTNKDFNSFSLEQSKILSLEAYDEDLENVITPKPFLVRPIRSNVLLKTYGGSEIKCMLISIEGSTYIFFNDELGEFSVSSEKIESIDPLKKGN